MKILHTADWHIGKMLHKYPLYEEMELYIAFLLETIKKEKIDLLLVSGDIFDSSNPSIRDKQMYFNTIIKLYEADIRVIITGGNHDSIGELNAPKEVLSAINTTVVGGAPDNIEDQIIEITNEKNELEVVILAVPFLRDRDLRKDQVGKTYEDRTAAIKAGIKDHYQKLADICQEKYPKQAVVAMGHLFAEGSSTSESERDIHVGNQAAVKSTIFPVEFDYVALGHIHRPQLVSKKEHIRYSGSPIALSFSEKGDDKSMEIIEIEQHKIKAINSIAIPKYRSLVSISGSMDEVENKLRKYTSEDPLPSFIELKIKEETFSALTISKVEELVSSYQDHDVFKILKHQSSFEKGQQDTASLFQAGLSIENISPKEVFKKRLEAEELDTEKQNILLDAFQELLEETE